MTLYLTDNIEPTKIFTAKVSVFVRAVKYYPAGTTTNSDSGVTDIRKCDRVFEAMQEVDLPLLLHGEMTAQDVDVVDRETVFIEQHLISLRQRFPSLRIVFEHITTSDAVEFVLATNKVASTITPQHLLFIQGAAPPLLLLTHIERGKASNRDRKCRDLRKSQVFLETDSAPHARHTKETSCGCAGCYSALHALELYAEAFEKADALDKL